MQDWWLARFIFDGDVDASFASHSDLNGKDCCTLYMDGGGTVMVNSKKQTLTLLTSSTDSELFSIGPQLLPDLLWARNFMTELDYAHRSTIPKGTPVADAE